METSEAFFIIKALMEKKLLVIQHQELVEWLERLESRGQVTEEEVQDLLQLARELNIYDLRTGEQLTAALN